MSLKLCYIWVEEYRNFRNTGFNFSSDIKYKYDNNTRTLKEIKVDSIPENFFGDNISEVTGLIGKNGSGKSNALELVCKLLKGGNSALKSAFLIITEEEGNNICYESSVNILRNETNTVIQSYEGSIDPLKIVYFSNVFDERVHNFDKEISDISNNYRYPRNKYPFILSNNISDFEKQIRFIESKSFHHLNIKHPEKIRVTSNYWNRRNQFTNRAYQRDGYIYHSITNFLSNFRKRTNDIKDDNKNFYYLVIYSLFTEAIRILDRIDPRSDRPLYMINELFDSLGFSDRNLKRTDEVVKDLLKWMIFTLEELFNDVNQTRLKKEIESLVKSSKSLLDLKYFFDNLKVDFVTEGSHSRKISYFVFDHKKIRSSEGRAFYELFRNQKLFQIDWVGISSGHKAYLNIFSLLNFELKKIRSSNLLLCIDEGDLYLHPQWQIEFFEKIITVLPELYKSNIQLILTSHSPFLLSDLPKQNLTIIDGELEEMSAINGTDLKKQTFAGNIYNLYSEPFFLQDNRTSLFAKKKIEKLIRKIENADSVPN